MLGRREPNPLVPAKAGDAALKQVSIPACGGNVRRTDNVRRALHPALRSRPKHGTSAWCSLSSWRRSWSCPDSGGPMTRPSSKTARVFTGSGTSAPRRATARASWRSMPKTRCWKPRWCRRSSMAATAGILRGHRKNRPFFEEGARAAAQRAGALAPHRQMAHRRRALAGLGISARRARRRSGRSGGGDGDRRRADRSTTASIGAGSAPRSGPQRSGEGETITFASRRFPGAAQHEAKRNDALEFGTIPEQRRIAIALHRIRDTRVRGVTLRWPRSGPRRMWPRRWGRASFESWLG